MKLEQYLCQSFPDGLTYYEASQLCLRLYCTLDNVPENLHSECNKNNLAKIFSNLSKKGFVKSKELEAALYGANFHDIKDKGHWIEVIASIFKKEDTVGHDLGEKLATHLIKTST